MSRERRGEEGGRRGGKIEREKRWGKKREGRGGRKKRGGR